jgi:hypothetical protein
MAEEIGTFSNTWKVLIFDQDVETLHAEPFEARVSRFTSVCRLNRRCVVSKGRSSILPLWTRAPQLSKDAG